MGKYAQLVVGPAGVGKSTYCRRMFDHLRDRKRRPHIVNLDPAVPGDLPYESSIDVRSLVTVEDMMQEYGLGPNGALMMCLQYLMENIAWFEEELNDFPDDYLIIDCPGQIELFTTVPFVKGFVEMLVRNGYHVCTIALVDASYIADIPRFLSGTFVCLASMVKLETAHINVLSKCDLLPGGTSNQDLEKILQPDGEYLSRELDRGMAVRRLSKTDRFARLNAAIGKIIEEYSLVRYVPLNFEEEESVEDLLEQIDMTLQFGEDEEGGREIPDDVDPEEDDEK
uniref:GPN-loop GTPase 3 n=1 Tax=Stygiella incarcerata TaxID=1712417 RepID=A0A192ZIL2_9EUKA|nr:GPN-loop GTPase 3 [Stygiella incarcerata]|eukprot:TRINITY_DN857_c2_g1_i1.p1 TRINITY_DN857_c2_g1~~TRINITY_DN857_c2_g1_i1.p1  ORF type:complete len:318 (-),score=84.66 TRINITY_DN857_c2_g1_i1:328-1176(-)